MAPVSKLRVNDAWCYDPPWVEEIPGEPFRYHVQSESRPEIFHLVDLTHRGGHGVCTCEHFQMAAYPNWKRHRQWIPYAPGRAGVSECRHIRAALDYFHLVTTTRRTASLQTAA